MNNPDRLSTSHVDRQSWESYYENTKDNPPSNLLKDNIALITEGSTVLDFGCGAGKDSKYLLQNNYRVVAVDADINAKKYLEILPNQNNLDIKISKFEDFNFDKYDAVNSSYALSFMNPDIFPKVFDKLLSSIKSGGIFMGNIFARGDGWDKPDADMTFLDEAEIRSYFNNFEIIKFEEEDAIRELASGSKKHWHQYFIVGKKNNL
jgi:cyclopropane fatty-acyl-phospholipid synthase-like methyltransferase